jgi:hypothetical protein
MRPYLEKTFTKIGLVEWLKVKGLSLSSSTATTTTTKAYVNVCNFKKWKETAKQFFLRGEVISSFNFSML